MSDAQQMCGNCQWWTKEPPDGVKGCGECEVALPEWAMGCIGSDDCRLTTRHDGQECACWAARPASAREGE